MPFEKRKAYIEFLGKTTVNVVTPYRNKTFDLKEGCTMDLISFKLDDDIHKEVSGFYAVFEYDDEEECYNCSVHMRISEDEIDEIGVCNIRDNKKVYSGSVWIKK